MMQTGIYEQLITKVINNKLDKDKFFISERNMDTAEQTLWLTRALVHVFHLAISESKNTKDSPLTQIELANKLIYWLQERVDNLDLSDFTIAQPAKLLTAIFDKHDPIAAKLSSHIDKITPLTGLTQSELFCGSNQGISLESEIKREILSSNRICWIVSFIKWTGLRIFMDELRTFTSNNKHKFQIITTSYMGATDLKAVQWLAQLPNTEVKLSYNHNQERLHAKSYLFMRDSGFHTGYIGSSNLSRSALTNGLEWNLKITNQEIPHIIEKTFSTFETYWQQPEFEIFDGSEKANSKLKHSLSAGSGDKEHSNTVFFDLTPHQHQIEILDRLDAERNIHDRNRNLIVAATGTGKTLISAFDFKRFYLKNPIAKILFIAHREEILVQAIESFRAVLKKSNFGELWVGQHKPDSYNQLFASIQSFNNQLDNINLSSDYYDFIVIDEVHHVSADSYRKFINHFSPKILLGLTATPERHDGKNILDDFGGIIAAELRLPEAINLRHLCPFQYFGIDDNTDLRQVKWENGRYNPSELTQLYTQNDQRLQKILQNIEELVAKPLEMRALAFCVNQEHARYMAEKFSLKGIPSAVLTSQNSSERHSVRQALQRGDINILCVIDIFNEGVDIPEIDTLLFLRPTESLTIFLQQLGRGLRHHDDKECVTVLDFVGNARAEYDFSQKFRALIGKTHTSISKEIEHGFPHLPLGCHIELQKKTKEIILENIKKAVLNQQKLKSYLQNFQHHTTQKLTLSNFLKFYSNIQLLDIYKNKPKKGGGWTRLLSDLKLIEKVNQTPIAENYHKAISNSLMRCDARTYLKFIRSLAMNDFTWIDNGDPIEQKMALMCHYDFWNCSGSKLDFDSLSESLAALAHPEYQCELIQVINYLLDTNDTQVQKFETDFPCPLQLNARYTREQIIAGLGGSSFEKQAVSREGVFNLIDLNVELLFVTLQKSDQHFSPTTRYHDYAMSPTHFHWQSQNSSKPESGKGLTYIQHKEIGKRLMLWVRESNKDENGNTMGFVNLGWVNFIETSGSQPMNITWELHEPMPSYLWKDAAKLANS
ncbi:DUF3427 domain-containing protein [Shewanella sp. NR704-98]|uniref:DUF3427 domain-containing protein n=2 Tax=Shewanella nanhaiensis TaxID=2864872 RepID=A0ABS7E8S2_9GAMM|nr:DUF3427 domain-containing protein [Shewanella nanhaiensis]